MGSICLLSDGGLPSVSCFTHYSFVRSFRPLGRRQRPRKLCLRLQHGEVHGVVAGASTARRACAAAEAPSHGPSAAAGRPASTSATCRVARHPDRRWQRSTAPAARLLWHAQGGQGDRGAPACPFCLRKHVSGVVCRWLRPIAPGVCGTLPHLQREWRSLPLRVLQLRPRRRPLARITLPLSAKP